MKYACRECTGRPPGTVRPAARWQDYVALLKPRVMSLVVFTGFAGLYLAPGHLNPLLAAVAARPTLVKPNEYELAEVAGLAVPVTLAPRATAS